MGESFSDRDLTTLGKLIDAMNFRSEWPQCKLLATKILKKKERASEQAKERGERETERAHEFIVIKNVHTAVL